MMKLKLPGDITGGLMIFGILFIIALFEFHIVKRAYRASESNDQMVCNSKGGDWHPNEEDNDPCCLLPEGVSAGGIPKCQGRLTPTSYCPEVCMNEPSSAFCKGMCTGMKG